MLTDNFFKQKLQQKNIHYMLYFVHICPADIMETFMLE